MVNVIGINTVFEIPIYYANQSFVAEKRSEKNFPLKYILNSNNVDI
jgi:hypothetical protein